MEYWHLIKHANKDIQELWTRFFENEIDNLEQSVGGCIKGTDTTYFIKNEDMSEDQKATYVLQSYQSSSLHKLMLLSLN